jgi:hypothetical protein
METRKEMILTALDAFVRQRSGMDPTNYSDGPMYRAEQRSITRDLHDYRQLSRAVELRDSITADDLIVASRNAFSGRLSIKELSPIIVGPGAYDEAMRRARKGNPQGFELDYCTGQYFPTEYRKAACAVMASALWASKRDL